MLTLFANQGKSTTCSDNSVLATVIVHVKRKYILLVVIKIGYCLSALTRSLILPQGKTIISIKATVPHISYMSPLTFNLLIDEHMGLPKV